ncbi:MAG TPA: hypothetical protein V6D17_20845 [Candidatus Obscuribacterales bacterium]
MAGGRQLAVEAAAFSGIHTGPLVALVNASDNRHALCARALKHLPGTTSVYTVTSVLAEAFWLLPPGAKIVDSVFNCLAMIGCKLITPEPGDLLRIQELMKKYADLPMDFADGEIVNAADKLSVNTIFTLDQRDFSLYRAKTFGKFRIIPE